MSESAQDHTSSTLGSVPLSTTFNVETRVIDGSDHAIWSSASTYTIDVASANISRNEFNKHTVALASLSLEKGSSLEVKVRYTGEAITTAVIRPIALHIDTVIEGDTISFNLREEVDIMLEINNDKWKALHILTNIIEPDAPTADTENIWYFGPGINNGSAYSQAIDGSIYIPSHTTVYLASGAFVTAKFIFKDVSHSTIRGPGCIWKDPVVHREDSYPRELSGSSILIERSTEILVERVASLGAKGFTLPVCQSKDVRINRYRTFSSAGNGDGIDLFCCRNVVIENCFLRTSDDCVAIYGHRWEYYGDTSNIQVKNCVLLPDIAHPVHVGTHGCPEKPETLGNIHFSDIDILDHSENQIWYQGCISINAGDENLIDGVLAENIRVERISKGQLVNIRVMKNAQWTSAPGRGVRNVTLRNIELLPMETGEPIVNPSMIMGFDGERVVENVKFEDLRVAGVDIHAEMTKPRWYRVEDVGNVYINEHVKGLEFASMRSMGKDTER